MAQPLPVTVYGPITPLNPAVKTTGALPGAQVIVLAYGGPIGDVVTAAGGELWVPLTSHRMSVRVSRRSKRRQTVTVKSRCSPFRLLMFLIRYRFR
jgi:hypothetical protein